MTLNKKHAGLWENNATDGQKPDYKEEIETARERYPSEFWDTLYEIPRGYHDIKRLKEFVAGGLAAETVRRFIYDHQEILSDEDLENAPNMDLIENLGPTCAVMAGNGFPFYVVTKPLVEMVAQTDAADGASLDDDAAPPFEAGALVFPLDTKLPGSEEGVTSLTVWSLTEFPSEGRRFNCISLVHQPDKTNIKFGSINLSDDGTIAGGYQEGDEDLEFLLTLFTAINCKGESLKDAPEVLRSVKSKKRGMPRRKICRPAFLGLSLKPNGYASSVTGEKGKVRWHIRRGHMRRVACGVGRTERVRRWIRPCLVNAPEKETHDD